MTTSGTRPATGPRDPARTPARSRLLGAVSGLLAAVAGLAAAEGVNALLTGVTGPFLAVGNRAVDAAPRPLKEFAIATFGDADKPVLLGGIAVTLVLLTALVGAAGVRRPRVALGAFVALAGVAAAAVLTDRSATASAALRLLPVAVLAVVSLAALRALLSGLRDSPPQVADLGAGVEAPPAPGWDRRRFLVTAATTVGVAVVGGVVARAYGGLAAAAARAGISLPRPAAPAPPVPSGVEVGVEGVTRHITPNADFYRVDTALKVPDVPLDDWRLRVFGLVDRELELSYDDLLAEDLVERRITLTCVSNEVGGDLLGNATWTGVPVRRLLERAGVRDGADAVRSRSHDDFTAGTPLARLLDSEHEALVALGMNAEPLPLAHGFPARLVTPGLYGYVSATKWLTELEVTRFADFKAYWTTRGYSAEAPIKTSSRIDVPRSFARLDTGRTVVAGVAWAQATGVDKVEVRVDGGRWEEARLGAEDNASTWRQWVWEWDAAPGNHRLEVRATDRDGTVQTGERAPIAPDGATGWHSVTVRVD
jgi:DMSO/TMAO reductase YedYZ molybdopterin-dependent catalytic subunit